MIKPHKSDRATLLEYGVTVIVTWKTLAGPTSSTCIFYITSSYRAVKSWDSMFIAAAVFVPQLQSSSVEFSQTISSSSSELDELTDAMLSSPAVAVAVSVMSSKNNISSDIHVRFLTRDVDSYILVIFLTHISDWRVYSANHQFQK